MESVFNEINLFLLTWNRLTTVKTIIFIPPPGCDIHGFWAMGFYVQYRPRWLQDFPVIWLAVPLGENGAHFRIRTLPLWRYDVASKWCGVTITTSLVEWTLSISEIKVFFCSFHELSSLKNTDDCTNKEWDKSKMTWAVSGAGQKFRARWVNCAIPPALAVSL